MGKALKTNRGGGAPLKKVGTITISNAYLYADTRWLSIGVTFNYTPSPGDVVVDSQIYGFLYTNNTAYIQNRTGQVISGFTKTVEMYRPI